MPNLEFTSANSPRLGSSRLQGINNQAAAAITPATILGSNLIAWFRADLGTWQNSTLTTQAVSNGDPVGGWVDQSGNGNNVLQATSAKRATLELNVVNGLPTVRFNGSSDYLQSVAFGSALDQPTTIIAVAYAASIASQFLMDGIAGSDRQRLGYSASAFDLYAGSDFTHGTPSASTWYIWNVVFNGSSSLMHINGAADTTGNPGTDPLTGVLLGASFGPGNYWTQDIAEIILASGAQSNTVRAALDSYCGTRYGITI